jgi:pteridine reductase
VDATAAGRVALVTGAGKRVGRAIALRLAAGGLRVAVHHHTSRDEAQATANECARLAGDSHALAADLGDPMAPAALVAAVLERFGRLDVLVNNASVFKPMKLDDFNVAAWDEHFGVNVRAVMSLVFVGREALRASRGRVINLCDASTARPWPSHLAYSASKGALETLTLALARALAPDVCVVGVAPGVVEWPPEYDEAKRKRILSRVPLGRAGTAADVAALVHYLATDAEYISGAIIPVDGGMRLG